MQKKLSAMVKKYYKLHFRIAGYMFSASQNYAFEGQELCFQRAKA